MTGHFEGNDNFVVLQQCLQIPLRHIGSVRNFSPNEKKLIHGSLSWAIMTLAYQKKQELTLPETKRREEVLIHR
jgi:hypothetical protein